MESPTGLLEDGETDFAGEQLRDDREEDGHDEEDVRRTDLSRGR